MQYICNLFTTLYFDLYILEPNGDTTWDPDSINKRLGGTTKHPYCTSAPRARFPRALSPWALPISRLQMQIIALLVIECKIVIMDSEFKRWPERAASTANKDAELWVPRILVSCRHVHSGPSIRSVDCNFECDRNRCGYSGFAAGGAYCSWRGACEEKTQTGLQFQSKRLVGQNDR